jgi:Zn-dependent protease with chaperone function
MRKWVDSLAITVIALATCAAQAQDVTDPDRGGPSRFLRGVESAASEAGVTDFPQLTDDQSGTVVRLYFSYNNWDIVFVTANSVSKEAMLEDTKHFAAGLDRPLADYYVFKGTKYLRIDVELNDYLPKDKGKRKVEFDLAAIAEQVSAMKSLPQPVWLVVEAEHADTTVLQMPGSLDKVIDDVGFFRVGAPETAGVLVQSAEVPWYAIPFLLALGTVFVFVPLFIGRNFLRRKAAEAGARGENLKSPDEIQSEYEKNRKSSWLVMLPILLAFPLVFPMLSGLDGLFQKSFRAVPTGFGPALSIIAFAPLGIPGIALLIRFIRDKRNPPPAVELTPELRQMKILAKLLLIPMFGVLLLVFLRLAVPNWATSMPPWLGRSLAFVVPVGVMAAMVFGFYRLRTQTHSRLPDDSPYREFAINAGVRIGAKIRDVFQIEADHVNAMATLNGKIGLTTGLLSKMEPEEIRAVIAHEIGHQRAKHVRTFFILSLCILIPLVGIHFYLVGRFPKMHPMLRGPIFIYPLAMLLPHLLLGSKRRKAEYEADLFAVEMMGDAELVIRTLHKLAYLNQTPTKLIGVDEKLSAHPSIANRETAIRERFQSSQRIEAERGQQQ